MKYFGEVPVADSIIKRLEGVEFQAFKALIKGFDAFPNKKFARVLHLRVESPELVSLQKRVQQALRNFDARPFKPHITLMRIKKQERPSTIFDEDFNAEFDVKEFVLFKSDLKPYGPEYEKVYVFKAANK